MKAGAGELEIVLGDIERALEARLWYAALVVALSVPDICSLLERPPEDMWSKRHKYAGWFDEYVAHHYRSFTGDDCYSLRGGVVHHGKFGHKDARYDRVAFHLPSAIRLDQIQSTNCGGFIGTTLSLDLALFCERMIDGARRWYQAKGADPLVLENLPNLVRYRNELQGHASGVPMIA